MTNGLNGAVVWVKKFVSSQKLTDHARFAVIQKTTQYYEVNSYFGLITI